MNGSASDAQKSDDGTIIYRGNLHGRQDASTGSRGTILSLSSSWDEDFGASATAEVQRVLDSVDSFLYEGTCVQALDGELQAECRRWRDAFVHLRAIGLGIAHRVSDEAENVSPTERNSGSVQRSCNTEPALSPVEDPLKGNVVDRLCTLFWPEVTWRH